MLCHTVQSSLVEPHNVKKVLVLQSCHLDLGFGVPLSFVSRVDVILYCHS